MTRKLRGTMALAFGLLWGCSSTDDEGTSDSDETSDSSTDTGDGGTETQGTGGSGGTSDAGDSDSGDGCTGTTELPYEPGDLPDTSGWEQVSISGIYESGGFEENNLLHPCEPAQETWCVYWAVRPFVPESCRGTAQVTGYLSEELDELELCNAVAGATIANRALVIEEIESVGPCDEMCQPYRDHCSVEVPVCEMPEGCES